ncbi:MAG: UbiA family prenyltransferase [Halobacteriota archaeon]
MSTTFCPLYCGVELAGGRLDDPRLPFILLVAWLISATRNVINDIVDRESDKRKWALRPLPSGLMSRSAAALFASVIAGIAFIITSIFFNWPFAALTIKTNLYGSRPATSSVSVFSID